MTGEELLLLLKEENGDSHSPPSPIPVIDSTTKKHVFGLAGIAEIFGCSIPTANRIKRSGKISKAITQIGRKIVVDVELALELAAKQERGANAS